MTAMRSLLVDDCCMLISHALQSSDIEHIRCNWWYRAPRNSYICSLLSGSLSRDFPNITAT
jgi:hypothetical protein